MWPHRRQPTRLPVPGILQARTLEWVAISFSNAWKWKVKVNSLSCVRSSATPWTAAFQAPPSMGFSRQEYWSGVPLPSPGLCTYWTLKEGYGHPSTMDHITTAPANKATKETYLSCVHGLSHGQSSVPGKNTGVGCHFLLQGIFLTQGSNLCQLHWQVDSLLLSHLGSP